MKTYKVYVNYGMEYLGKIEAQNKTEANKKALSMAHEWSNYGNGKFLQNYQVVSSKTK